MKVKFALCLSLCFFSLHALEVEDLTWEQTGPSAQEFNEYLQRAIDEKDWWAVIDYSNILSYHFPSSPFAQDSSFLIGKSYFELGHFFMANEYFTAYLQHNVAPKHFEDTIALKFAIAEKFYHGEKKPFVRSHKGPKWLSAKEDALVIYDEVLATLPHSEFAVRALFGKAMIQEEMDDYKPGLETLDTLIRRFPKHDLAAAAYLEKIHIFLLQCQGKSLDPDLLDFADVTLRKFRSVFPREPRLEKAESYIHEMEEIFARNLLDTGAFFQKTKKLPAAIIYYKKAVAKYPNTQAALLAKEKLAHCDAL